MHPGGIVVLLLLLPLPGLAAKLHRLLHQIVNNFPISFIRLTFKSLQPFRQIIGQTRKRCQLLQLLPLGAEFPNPRPQQHQGAQGARVRHRPQREMVQRKAAS